MNASISALLNRILPGTGLSVTDGHGVHADLARQQYARRLLTEVETGNGTSQRSLARRAGMALGLTNLILKTLVSSGWVSVSRVDGHVRYVITPEGVAEKNRMSAVYFSYTTRLYAEARDGVRDRLRSLSTGWIAGTRPADAGDDGRKTIALYGAGDAAEISYVSIQESDLVVTAVFDEASDRRPRFFGLDVRPVTALEARSVWETFGVLAVMEFDAAAQAVARTHLDAIGFPAERVFWL